MSKSRHAGSRTYWVSALIELWDGDEEDCVDAVLFWLPDTLYEDVLEDEGEYGSLEVIFSLTIPYDQDPTAWAIRAIAHCVGKTRYLGDVKELAITNANDALAGARSGRPCPRCGPRHRFPVCSTCDVCINRAIDNLVSGPGALP